jgi:hypothetical protein
MRAQVKSDEVIFGALRHSFGEVFFPFNFMDLWCSSMAKFLLWNRRLYNVITDKKR